MPSSGLCGVVPADDSLARRSRSRTRRYRRMDRHGDGEDTRARGGRGVQGFLYCRSHPAASKHPDANAADPWQQVHGTPEEEHGGDARPVAAREAGRDRRLRAGLALPCARCNGRGGSRVPSGNGLSFLNIIELYQALTANRRGSSDRAQVAYPSALEMTAPFFCG